MKTNTENWRGFLYTLNDDLFFTILRNYLGPIQTPYNKHDLVDRLELFIDKNSDKILERLSEDESELLSALHTLKPINAESVISFFEGSKPGSEIYRLLLNLKDRLLIFRDPENNQISINPLLIGKLQGKGVGSEQLFPSTKITPGRYPLPWYNDNLVQGLLSCLMDSGPLFKNDGTMRKSAAKRIEAQLPELYKGGEEQIKRLCDSLISLGLLRSRDQVLEPVISRIEEWGDLGTRQRHFYYWAAFAMVYQNKSLSRSDDGSFSNYEKTRQLAAFIHNFIREFPLDEAYGRDTLMRILQLHISEESIPVSQQNLLSALIDARVLVLYGRNLGINPAVPGLFSEEDNSHPGPSLVIQSDYRLTIHPHASIKMSFPLAISSSLIQFDLISNFEINKESLFRALSIGLSRESILNALVELSQNHVPQNVEFSISSWIDEFSAVKLVPGYLLSCDEKSIPAVVQLAEKRGDILTLGSGHFLFPSEEMSWVEELETSGVPAKMLLNLRNQNAEEASAPIYPFEEKRKTKTSRSLSSMLAGSTHTEKTVAKKKSTTDASYGSLIEKVESLKLPDDSQKELILRIKNGLILNSDQIDPKIIRPDITEAKGLNYNSKLRLIEMALSSGDMLEFFTSGQEGGLLLKPVKVHKKAGSGGDLLEALQIPGDKQLSIHISKARLIRRLRGSLFNTV